MALDYRRLTPAIRARLGQLAAPGYETTARDGAPAVPDESMLARREYRQRHGLTQPAADGGQALALRRRQLELLRLAAG
jgi:hypothetical protein